MCDLLVKNDRNIANMWETSMSYHYHSLASVLCEQLQRTQIKPMKVYLFEIVNVLDFWKHIKL